MPHSALRFADRFYPVRKSGNLLTDCFHQDFLAFRLSGVTEEFGDLRGDTAHYGGVQQCIEQSEQERAENDGDQNFE